MRLKRLCAGLAALLSLLVLSSSASASHDVTERLSYGPTGGNGATPRPFRGISSDGSRVFFQTDRAAGQRRHRLRDRRLRALGRDHDADLDRAQRRERRLRRHLQRHLAGRQQGLLPHRREAGQRGHRQRDRPLHALGRHHDAALARAERRQRHPDRHLQGQHTGRQPRVLRDRGVAGHGGDDATSRATSTSGRAAPSPGSRPGRSGGNDSDFDAFYEGSSTDGTRVFLSTDESLDLDGLGPDARTSTSASALPRRSCRSARRAATATSTSTTTRSSTALPPTARRSGWTRTRC